MTICEETANLGTWHASTPLQHPVALPVSQRSFSTKGSLQRPKLSMFEPLAADRSGVAGVNERQSEHLAGCGGIAIRSPPTMASNETSGSQVLPACVPTGTGSGNTP